jgi:hypothetical protein
MAEAVCAKDRKNCSAMSELDLNPRSTPTARPGNTSPTQQFSPPTPQFAVATQPTYARTLFLDPQGLRPGWGLAFYAVTFLLLQRLAADLAASWDLGAGGLWSMMLAEFGSLVAAVVPAAVLARVEHRPWSVCGLPLKQAFRR